MDPRRSGRGAGVIPRPRRIMMESSSPLSIRAGALIGNVTTSVGSLRMISLEMVPRRLSEEPGARADLPRSASYVIEGRISGSYLIVEYEILSDSRNLVRPRRGRARVAYNSFPRFLTAIKLPQEGLYNVHYATRERNMEFVPAPAVHRVLCADCGAWPSFRYTYCTPEYRC